MTETKADLAAQYASAYGPYVSGDFPLCCPARAQGITGQIVWSYRASGRGPVQYVLDDGSGWPVEVAAAELEVIED